ncbi:putative flavodoxin/nitric oxide synthase [uncultured Desulfobacterium sp.]|uniref:Putative flavodoxin/nitric oxide synthase n=1 Tax=uncultured Desulfobacterium sp. TaxID=201089 RepID=A0A445MYS0_9BACT|nr:putative flavodoxin/nitric oxide synthase [uncultured Desulfobacterium sp.]
MGKVLVVYATNSGGTKRIGDIIAEGIRLEGHEAAVVNVTDIKTEKDLEGYDGYALGSATYHGEMMGKMKTMLFLAEKANLEGKPAGSFGSFGWSGEATDRIFDTMKHIFKMDVVSGSLRLKSAHLQGGVQMAQDYGRQIAKKLK